MMRKIKQVLCLLLTGVLLLGTLPMTVMAAGGSVTYTEIVTAEEYAEYLNGYSAHMSDFHDGVAWFGYSSVGAFDTDGNNVVPPRTYYKRETGDFSDGVAWAYNQKDRVWVAVDTSGRELFTLDSAYRIYDYCAFHDGLSKVIELSTGKYGYVDTTGKLVIPCVHDSRCGNFSDGLAVCFDRDYGYYGYMDKTGKMVIPAKYTQAGTFNNGVALVNDGKRWTVIDKTGKDIIPADCSCGNNPIITSQVVQVSYNGNYAFVNRAGQIVSSGFKNAETYNYADGIIKVSKYDDASGYQRIGFVNEAGELVIPCQYSNVSNFMDGYAYITQSESGQPTRYTFIDKAGNTLGTYTAENGVVLGPAGNGCFVVQGNRRYGFVDYTGKEIAPRKYIEIGATYTTDATMHRNFSGGVIPVQNADKQWGFLDTKGNMVIECSLSDVKFTNEPGIYEVQNLHGKGTGWSVIKFSPAWTEPSVGNSSANSTSADSTGTSNSLSNLGNPIYKGTWMEDNGGWWLQTDNSLGYAANQWADLNGTWYLFDASGYMVTGWASVDGKWYYLRADGSMASGWVESGGQYYYLGSDGVMLTSTTTPDGYVVDASGVWVH